jgi:hypothetical protein
MTEPLTPPDLDLRDFDWMPLDVARLRDSDLSVLAPGDAFRAAVLLWCASWHQIPAASLPAEDRLLANLAGYGRDLKGWSSVRDDALRGFVKCSDGRLYHPVVAEKAIEAHAQRNKQRRRTEAATSARRNGKRNDQRDDDRNDTSNGPRNEDHLTLPNPTLPSEAHASEAPRAFFEEFWKAYPRRDTDEQRERAEEKFNALVKTGVDPKVITFGARAYCAKTRKQNNYATRYVKVAWRWLAEQEFSETAAAVPAEDIVVEPAEKDWRSAVKRWLLNESNWPRWAGNSPGSKSCRCPPEILAECGVCPNTARRIDDRWYFAEIGTPELAANLSFAEDRKLKIRLYDFVVDGVEKEGAHFMVRFPPGYDQATGGRLDPATAEDAA